MAGFRDGGFSEKKKAREIPGVTLRAYESNPVTRCKARSLQRWLLKVIVDRQIACPNLWSDPF
jgi:hypothetical protein